jgi:hypothetical protein
VTSRATLRQPPPRSGRRCSVTGTPAAHLAKPSVALTVPRARREETDSDTLRAWLTAKAVVLVPVPPGVVTEIGPAPAPAGTVAVNVVGEVTANVAAGVPANYTAVAPVRLAPVMATEVPTAPPDGVKEAIDGGGLTA